MAVDRTQLESALAIFIVEEFLKDDKVSIEAKSPLLEWGILNSMNTFKLLNHIHARYGVEIGAAELVGENFRDIRAITSLVLGHLDGTDGSSAPA